MAGTIKSLVLGAALAVGLALPAQAQDKKLNLGGTAAFTTDYIFRGVSNSDQLPAVQASFDATYGIFYAGLWGTNTDFGDNIEIDYYIGMLPKWGNVTFDFAALYYTFPGSNPLDYLELKAGASWSGGNWTLTAANYWSPNNFGLDVTSNATEGSVAYRFGGKLFNFFTPTISGLVGYMTYEAIVPDYTYWNAGLNLGFMERWTADIRYWDTSYDADECFINSGGRNNCDARVVGTVKVVF